MRSGAKAGQTKRQGTTKRNKIRTLTTLNFDIGGEKCSLSPRLDYSPCHLPSTPPPCCKALLLRCGTLKTHTVHSGPAMADLLCSCAVFHFILQLAGMPLQEDTAKSPRSGHTATLLIITHTRHVPPLLRLPPPPPARY